MDCPNWAHMDIAGVMEDDGEIPYLRKGMTGKENFLVMKINGSENAFRLFQVDLRGF